MATFVYGFSRRGKQILKLKHFPIAFFGHSPTKNLSSYVGNEKLLHKLITPRYVPRQRFDLKIIKHVPHASYVGEWSQFWGRRSGAHGVYVMAAAPARYNVCVWGQAINHMCIQVVHSGGALHWLSEQVGSLPLFKWISAEMAWHRWWLIWIVYRQGSCLRCSMHTPSTLLINSTNATASRWVSCYK